MSGRDGGCAAQAAGNDSEDLSGTVDAPPAHAFAALAAARVVEPRGSAAPEAEAAATPARKLRRRSRQTEDTLRTGSSERHAEPTASVRFVLDAAAAQASASTAAVEDLEPVHVVFPSVEDWWSWSSRARYDWIVEHVRSFWCTKLLPTDAVRTAELGSLAGPARFTAKRKAFGALENVQKLAALAKWVLRSGAPEHVAERAKTVFVAGVGRRSAGARTVLLTCMGPWLWCWKDGAVRNAGGSTLAEVVEELRNDARVSSLWVKVRRHAQELQLRMKASDFACCLEVCPRTFEEERHARLHVRVFLRAGHRVSLPPLRLLELDGTTAVVADVVGGLPTGKQAG